MTQPSREQMETAKNIINEAINHKGVVKHVAISNVAQALASEREKALEEAAKEAESKITGNVFQGDMDNRTKMIVQAIRQLKEKS